MDLHPDLIELLSTLSASKVRYLIVGAHAVAFHGHPRFTKDLDVWVEPSSENAQRVWHALKRFGAPLADMTPEDFANPRIVYQMGAPPHRVDVMSGIDGVEFDEAWPRRGRGELGGQIVHFVGREDLQDLRDVRKLDVYERTKRRKRSKKPRQ
jgi:hypothetical protein